MKTTLLIILFSIFYSSMSASDTTQVGPQKGTLFMCGGVWTDPVIRAELARLLGPDTARVVLIPTAAQNLSMDSRISEWTLQGYQNVVGLHARTREEANSDSLVAIIDNATAVWCYGGSPSQLYNRYSNTKIEEAFWRLLHRGGFFGGSSAGAMVQCSYYIGVLTYPPEELPDTIGIEDYGYFSFLANSTILPHADGSWAATTDAVLNYPEIFGIAVADASVAIVQGDTLRIHGNQAAIYDSAYIHSCEEDLCYQPMVSGEIYNLHTRQFINRAPTTTGTVPNFNLTLDEWFSHTFSEDLFEDVDISDSLEYYIEYSGSKVLTNGFNFDVETLTFSGTPTRKGFFYLHLFAKDKYGAFTKYDIEVTIEDAVEISKNNWESNLNIHYNVDDGTIKINFPEVTEGAYSYSIYNLLGTKLKEQTVYNTAQVSIPVNNFTKGTYIVQIQRGNQRILRKVLVR